MVKGVQPAYNCCAMRGALILYDATVVETVSLCF